MEALGLGKGQTSLKTYTMNNTRFSKKKKQKQKSSSHFLKNKIHFPKKKTPSYKNQHGLEGLVYSGKPANEKVSARLVRIQLV